MMKYIFEVRWVQNSTPSFPLNLFRAWTFMIKCFTCILSFWSSWGNKSIIPFLCLDLLIPINSKLLVASDPLSDISSTWSERKELMYYCCLCIMSGDLCRKIRIFLMTIWWSLSDFSFGDFDTEWVLPGFD